MVKYNLIISQSTRVRNTQNEKLRKKISDFNALRVLRCQTSDIFALLPVWQVEVTCQEADRTVLNIKFTRDSFELLNFEKIDASDTIRKLGGIIGL